MGILSQVCLTYYDMKKMKGIPGLRELLHILEKQIRDWTLQDRVPCDLIGKIHRAQGAPQGRDREVNKHGTF